jgi:hypothetical protein
MASHRYRDQPDVERKFVRQELLAGWLALFGKAISLGLSLALGVIAVKHAPHASEWRVTAGTGSGSIFCAGVSAAIGKGGKPGQL